MSEYKLNILHLYPDLLNLYGDKGNIECMKRRLIWRGIDAEVSEIRMNSRDIDFENTDIIYLGGGSDREQEVVLTKLLKYKKEFSDYVESGKSLLATCGGYYMLGEYYEIDSEKTECLGILDITAKTSKKEKRLISNAILKSELTDSPIVGFENHGARCETGDYKPLGSVVTGFGNDGKSGFEGVVYKNLIGTNLHGPLLPKNPQLCDYILKNALKYKYSSFSTLVDLDDEIENLANNYIVQEYTK